MDKETELLLTGLISQVKENKTDLSREIHGGLKGIRHYVDANSEVLVTKIDTIIEDDKKRNGALLEHAKCIDVAEKRMNVIDMECRRFDRHIGLSERIVKQWKLIIAVIVVGMYLMHNAMEYITISQIINFFK